MQLQLRISKFEARELSFFTIPKMANTFQVSNLTGGQRLPGTSTEVYQGLPDETAAIDW